MAFTVLRHALARAGIVEGYEHRCRWCAHRERASDAEPRFCPTCRKVTDGRGRPLADPRGRRLWPVALHVPIRFHDLRHTFADGLRSRPGLDVRPTASVGPSGLRELTLTCSPTRGTFLW